MKDDRVYLEHIIDCIDRIHAERSICIHELAYGARCGD